MMLDDKHLHPDPNLEQAIFIQPYFSTLRKMERRTKSTTLMVITSKLNFVVREITHSEHPTQVNWSGTL